MTTDLLQEHFGPGGVLIVICELEPLPLYLPPELSALRVGRLHRIPATLGRLPQAFSYFGQDQGPPYGIKWWGATLR